MSGSTTGYLPLEVFWARPCFNQTQNQRDYISHLAGIPQMELESVVEESGACVSPMDQLLL